MEDALTTRGRSSPRTVGYRHTVVVRVSHWIGVLCLSVLLMSGLQIFNAHPALYWGEASVFERPVLALTAAAAGRQPVGTTMVLGRRIDTTGLLGLSFGSNGQPVARGFPAWITLPGEQDLATGRRWHFFFAWLLVVTGFVYYLHGIASGHWRALVPTLRELGRIGRSIGDHLRLRFDHGASYNVLQKLSYLAVLAILLPLMVASGLAMSPGFDAAVPELLSVLGGRQSARTVHFLTAWLLVAFVVVHVAMVLVSGLWNNLRSMITGRYVAKPAGRPNDETS